MVNKVLFAFLIVISVVSCVQPDDFVLNQSVTIGYGDTMVNSEEGLSITLTNVADSRCQYFGGCGTLPVRPVATVRFEVALKGEVVTIDLSTDDIEEGIGAYAFGYLFTLQELSPPQFYGGCRQLVNEQAYEAELVVTYKDCSGTDC